MRIVAGKARGRPLRVPKGASVRPTTDRVREALFSALGQRVCGASVLDLFAGSGALALEALSRGAARAVLVERWAKAREVIRANMESTGLLDDCTLVPGDGPAFLRRAAAKGDRFDLVFMDPPYDSGLLEEAMALCADSGILRPAGLLVAEHPSKTTPAAPPGLRGTWSRRYGDSSLSFFEGEDID